MVRISIPDKISVKSLRQIIDNTQLPVIADIHFDHTLAIKSLESGVHKIRINPGNINSKEKIDEIIRALKIHNKAVRIGINSGSLEKSLENIYKKDPSQALFESARNWTEYFSERGIENLVVSIKSSSVPITIKANKLYSKEYSFPIHLGITESGTIKSGSIYSSVGIGILLYLGIGDTIRVSLSGDPVEEIYVAKTILKSLGISKKGPRIISCPTCARSQYNVTDIAEKIEELLLKENKDITVAIMGCVVNGPGEAKEADIGIAGSSTKIVLFKKGKIFDQCPPELAVSKLWKEIENFKK